MAIPDAQRCTVTITRSSPEGHTWAYRCHGAAATGISEILGFRLCGGCGRSLRTAGDQEKGSKR